jgi:NAD(P)-dependent dehydrogenase (short-subunit alcohol dehydrogenase family)
VERKPINQQVVVVVGASSGIGRAAALLFAEKGARVVVAARSAPGLDSLVQEIRSKGGNAIAVVADVADVSQVDQVAARAVAEHGRIDTWVHLAAVSVWAPFEQTRPEEFKRVLDVNLLGQIHGALAALPHLRAQGCGGLIHVSSVEGRVSIPYNSAYAASKHGVQGFLGSLRLELMREGVPISVTAILPSTIDTPFFENALTRLGVQPRGPAPVYAPELVARAIVDAAEHPAAEIVVGGGGALLLLMKRLTPRLLERILLTRVGFESQLTDRTKSAEAPNNLASPIPGARYQVHGDLGAEAARTSLYTALETSAPARLARKATLPALKLVARGFEALWALRFPANARTAVPRERLGVAAQQEPAPVVMKRGVAPGKKTKR